VKAAEARFNRGAALVIYTALKASDSTQKALSEVRSGTVFFSSAISCAQFSPDPISVANIIMKLSHNDDLGSGLILSSKKATNAAYTKEYLGILSSADNPTPAGRATSFVSFGSSKVQVEFELVCGRLRRGVLESVTRERHGIAGVRILRLLLETGKLDEKQVRLSNSCTPTLTNASANG
jgi:DNA-directed RNA polymerase III subunit RPC3